jgi:hypothetical protein
MFPHPDKGHDSMHVVSRSIQDISFTQMGMRAHIPLLLLLAFTCIADAQSTAESPTANEPTAQQSSSTSGTYSETLQMLKVWLDTEEDDQLARLFSVGDTRTSDLLAACRNVDDGIAGAVFLTLQLLGRSDSDRCLASVWQRHSGLLFLGAANLSVAQFERIDRWLAKKRTPDGYECGDQPLIDDSLVYALILDGSPRSKATMTQMRSLEEACSGTDTIAGEPLERARSLSAEAKTKAHDLKPEPSIERAIRASAFFLPPKYRKDCNVELLARTDNRILLDVSYRCGRLCGRGYYVVLRRDGQLWQYAVIRVAWMS